MKREKIIRDSFSGFKASIAELLMLTTTQEKYDHMVINHLRRFLISKTNNNLRICEVGGPISHHLERLLQIELLRKRLRRMLAQPTSDNSKRARGISHNNSFSSRPQARRESSRFRTTRRENFFTMTIAEAPVLPPPKPDRRGGELQMKF